VLLQVRYMAQALLPATGNSSGHVLQYHGSGLQKSMDESGHGGRGGTYLAILSSWYLFPWIVPCRMQRTNQRHVEGNCTYETTESLTLTVGRTLRHRRVATRQECTWPSGLLSSCSHPDRRLWAAFAGRILVTPRMAQPLLTVSLSATSSTSRGGNCRPRPH